MKILVRFIGKLWVKRIIDGRIVDLFKEIWKIDNNIEKLCVNK